MKTSIETLFRFFAVSMAFAIAATAFTPSYGKDPGSKRPGSEEAVAVARANAALDRVYGQLITKLDSKQKNSLKESQRAWIKWRDAEADFIARLSGAAGGSAFRVDYSTVQAKLIEQRTETLSGYLKKAESEKE